MIKRFKSRETLFRRALDKARISDVRLTSVNAIAGVAKQINKILERDPLVTDVSCDYVQDAIKELERSTYAATKERDPRMQILADKDVLSEKTTRLLFPTIYAEPSLKGMDIRCTEDLFITLSGVQTLLPLDMFQRVRDIKGYTPDEIRMITDRSNMIREVVTISKLCNHMLGFNSPKPEQCTRPSTGHGRTPCPTPVPSR
jgi:hypothetical protein